MKKRRNYQLIFDRIFAAAFGIMTLYDVIIAHNYSDAISNFLITMLLLRLIQFEKIDDENKTF